MSSIVEGYRTVIKSQSEREAEESPPIVEVDPVAQLVTAAANELAESLQERCKWHDTDENTLVIQSGNSATPAIVVEVKGYATQEGVVTASQQEDSTKIREDLPPTDNTTDYPTEATDQVAEVRKYNTEQYMKHSNLNPNKFG